MASKNAKFEDEFSFQCRAYKLPAYVRQFSFANSADFKNPRKRHRADFCFPHYWLIVEIDGGIWMPGGGAHSHPIDIERNMRKRNDAVYLGYSVLAFTPKEVTNGFAVAFVQRVLFGRGWRQNESEPQPEIEHHAV